MNEIKHSTSYRIEAMKEDICDNYCKYPVIWHEEHQDEDLEEVCNNCPLNKLDGFWRTSKQWQ